MVAAVCAASGCVNTRVARLRTETDLATTLTSHEVELSKGADEAEKSLVDAGAFLEDPELERYLQAMTARLLDGFGAAGKPVRTKIAHYSSPNAAAFPNGLVVINSGLVAKLRSSGQLAIILGHELEHYLGRHPARTLRAEQNGRVAGAVAIVLLAMIGAADGSVAAAGEMYESMTMGYSRDLENEADAAGLRAAAVAGFDVERAAEIFEIFIAERAEYRIDERLLYRDHPADAERIASYRRQLEKMREADELPRPSPEDDDEFESALLPVFLVACEDDLALHRIDDAKRGIERYLARRSDNPRAHYLLGEVLRREAAGHGENLDAIAAAYGRAVALDPAYADAQRELGLTYRDAGRGAEADRHLRRYLALAPEAPDRAIIESYLDGAGRGRASSD